MCCPLTDHLVGTFVPEREWRPRARSTYASSGSVSNAYPSGDAARDPRRRREIPTHRWHGEELSVEQQIKNHIARESFGLGEVKIAPGAKKGDGGGASGWVEKAEVVLA